MTAQSIATIFIALLTCATAAFTYLATGKMGKAPTNKETFTTLRHMIDDLNERNTELIIEVDSLQNKVKRLESKIKTAASNKRKKPMIIKEPPDDRSQPE